jgi:hypothetical protein
MKDLLVRTEQAKVDGKAKLADALRRRISNLKKKTRRAA